MQYYIFISLQSVITIFPSKLAAPLEFDSLADDDTSRISGRQNNVLYIDILWISLQELEEEVKAGRWFHVSDAYVAEVNIERVMKAQAYLLFYERLVWAK